jgi:nucleotide-binding universal stress UspA family protein
MFRNVVLLLDGSALTERALHLAAQIAQEGGGSRLIVLRLLPSPSGQDEGNSLGLSAVNPARAATQADLEAFLQR